MRVLKAIISLCVVVAVIGLAVWIGQGSPISGAATKAEKAAELPKIAKEGPQPKAVTKTLAHDFGLLAVGEERSHTFIIKNEGEAPLTLTKGETTCKCTLSELDDNTIPPGGEGKVELTVTPKAEAKNFSQTATIHTNDPERQEIEFRAYGNVVQNMVVDPATDWKIPVIDTDEPQNVSGTIYSALRDSFNIVDVKKENPALSIDVQPLSDDELKDLNARSGYRVTAQMPPDIEIGSFREKITLKTDAQRNPADPDSENLDFVVYVEGQRIGPIRLLPGFGAGWNSETMTLNLGRFQAADGKSVQMSIFAQNPPDGEFKIESIEVDPEFLNVTAEPAEQQPQSDRTRLLLKVEFPKGHPPVTHGRDDPGTITLHTNHPKAKVIRLKVGFIAS